MMVDLPSRGYKGGIYLGSFLRYRPLWLKYEGHEKLLDYPVKCVLTNRDIPFEKLRPDKRDLLFISYDGEAIPHWIETADNSKIVVWLKFSRILYGKETFWLYYGNGNFSGLSYGEDVFLFFDDFNNSELDTSKWSVVDGNAVVEESYLKLQTSGTTDDIQALETFEYNIAWRTRVKLFSGGTYLGGYFWLVPSDYSLSNRLEFGPREDRTKVCKNNSCKEQSYAYTADEAIYELRRLENKVSFLRNNEVIHEYTDTTYLPTIALGPAYRKINDCGPMWIDFSLIRKYKEEEPFIEV